MLTEDEAKTKWCPMSRHPIYPMDDRPSGGNSMQTGEFMPTCIGSACMMWRWQHMGGDHNQIGEPISPVPAHGYCGLAGKP
jgi:hypothetical protein